MKMAGVLVESLLFLTDLLTAHEPELRKPLEINKTIFRFMGRFGYESVRNMAEGYSE